MVTRPDSPVAVVTGAARGLGLEVCRQLGALGMRVVLTAHDADAGELAATALAREGLPVRFAHLDVTDAGSVERLAGRLRLALRRVDVLVSNAAAPADWSATPSSVDLEEARAILEVNLMGAWCVVQELLPLVRESRKGRIVLVSSSAGSHDEPGTGLAASPSAPAYAVSKAALNALTAKLAVELSSTRVLVNAVCPGVIATAPGLEAIGGRPVGEAAATVVWAATLPDDGPSGGLFRDGQRLAW